MKNFKNLSIYFFATIGFVVIACSAAATTDNPDDNPDVNPPIVQSSIGKYQIHWMPDPQNNYGAAYVILNTENGQVKGWRRDNNDQWILRHDWKSLVD